MTLYYVKDQGSLRMTSNIFGVAPCTLSLIIKQVCQTIVKVLASKMIRFPTSENELRELMTRFENKFGFPELWDVLMAHISPSNNQLKANMITSPTK